MIDTVHLHLDRVDILGYDTERFAQALDTANTTTSLATGEVWSSGRLNNLLVSFSEAGVTIKGSLSGYYHPNNSRILTRHEVALALNKMEDELHLSLAEARVSRLDCSYHWQMSLPIGEYLSRLGGLTYFQRVLATSNSLYYNKGGRKPVNTLLFYNKTKECSESHKEVPEVYDDVNLLRYECRWLGRVARQLNVTEVKASTLAEKEFYKLMVKRWSEYYFAIHKNRAASWDMSNISTVKGACDWLLGYLLNNADAGEVQEVLEQMKNRQVFSDAKYYSRLRRHLKEVAQVAQTITHDLMRELDNNVREVLAYCR